jgi:P27 family predicted phage terminase small subunit
MGSRGPANKPTALKILQGTNRKDRTPSNEPKPPEFQELPNAPSYFDSVAKKEWQRLGPDLMRLGLLTIADIPLFETMCLCYARIVQAQKALKKFKSLTYEHTNKADAKNFMVLPEIQIIQKESIILKSLAAEFGCTPSARSRMNAPDIIPAGGLGGQSGKGGFSEYLGGRRKRDMSSS